MSLDEVVDVAGTETAGEAAGKAAGGGGGDSVGSAVRRHFRRRTLHGLLSTKEFTEF